MKQAEAKRGLLLPGAHGYPRMTRVAGRVSMPKEYEALKRQHRWLARLWLLFDDCELESCLDLAAVILRDLSPNSGLERAAKSNYQKLLRWCCMRYRRPPEELLVMDAPVRTDSDDKRTLHDVASRDAFAVFKSDPDSEDETIRFFDLAKNLRRSADRYVPGEEILPVYWRALADLWEQDPNKWGSLLHQLFKLKGGEKVGLLERRADHKDDYIPFVNKRCGFEADPSGNLPGYEKYCASKTRGVLDPFGNLREGEQR